MAVSPDSVRTALDHGFVHVAYRPQMLQSDSGATMQQGVIGLARWPRERTDWGALRAWAWGASQLREEMARDPRVNGERISLAGHSRFGKGVLVAAAFDHAFADANVSSSGAGGACRDLAKAVRRELDRDAAVAGRVFMAAAVTGAVVAEQQRAGMEKCAAGVGRVGEAAGDDGRDGNAAVALLEGAVPRSGAADELVERPAVAAGEAARRRLGLFENGGGFAHGPNIAIFPKRRKLAGSILLTSRRQLSRRKTFGENL